MRSDKERGNFEWDGDEVVWVASDKGELIIHPVLGPMKATDPMQDVIIGTGLAIEIDQSLRKLVKKYINEK